MILSSRPETVHWVSSVYYLIYIGEHDFILTARDSALSIKYLLSYLHWGTWFCPHGQRQCTETHWVSSIYYLIYIGEHDFALTGPETVHWVSSIYYLYIEKHDFALTARDSALSFKYLLSRYIWKHDFVLTTRDSALSIKYWSSTSVVTSPGKILYRKKKKTFCHDCWRLSFLSFWLVCVTFRSFSMTLALKSSAKLRSCYSKKVISGRRIVPRGGFDVLTS
jgi:hypothetical protein